MWRSSTDITDRLLACLPYAIPMLEAYPFGLGLFALFPPLAIIGIPLIPFGIVSDILGSILGPFSGVILFFLLYFFVVRNFSIRHFIRFNTMVALLISICLSLIGILFEGLGFSLKKLPSLAAVPGMGYIILILASIAFLAAMGAAIYAIIHCCLGKYAEIPMISDAANAQVRY
ncbi:MAG: Tic20 family protein [Synechococcales bacterium]|nr:Tic20 family protein [Synechococcales bacterium]